MLSKEGNAIKHYLIIVLICFSNNGFAQSVLDKTISFYATDISISDALLQLSDDSGVEITFSKHFFEEHKNISIALQETSLESTLQRILRDTGIDFKISGKRILLFRKKTLFQTISGYVQDNYSAERLIAATVYCPALEKGTTTNEYGFFSLQLPSGPTDLVISYIGYKAERLQLNLQQDIQKTIALTIGNTLEEVVVRPKQDSLDHYALASNYRYVAPNEKLSTYSPSLGGFKDPIRTTQLLAGVQSGTDGLDGIYVRGGDSGQNLMMLDGVPVYIPYHLFGLYSVYNQDVIKSSKLFKGNFPASYGGRLSSVFDIRTREGNQFKWSGSAASNLVGTSLSLEGPLKKGKSALLLSSRISHPGILLDPFFRRTYFNQETEAISSAFLDLNVKLHHSFSDKDRLYLSFYHGQDQIDSSDDLLGDFESLEQVSLAWANSIASLRWNHLYNNKLFSNTTLTYSFFNYEYAVLDQSMPLDTSLHESFFIDIYSNNKDLGIKTDFDYTFNEHHQFRFGGDFSYKRFIPELTFIDEEDEAFDGSENVNIEALQKRRDSEVLSAIQADVYIEDQMELSKKWQLTLGLRGSNFFTENKNYFRLEPRFFSFYKMTEKLATRASINRMIQYLHLVSHTSIRLPNDIWMPSDEKFKPQEAWQAELGLDLQLNKKIKLVAEAYYKEMYNLYAFSEDYILKKDVNFRDFLVRGEGVATGLEFAIDYQAEKNGVKLSYTYATTSRLYNDINDGMVFPHAREYHSQVKLFAFRKLGKGLHLGLNWMYNSAGPTINITSLNGLQGINQHPVPTNLSEFLSDYHRLDLDLNYKFRSRKFAHSFNVGAYNVYNRKNLAYYRIDINADGQVSFLPVNGISFRPSFSYQLKF